MRKKTTKLTLFNRSEEIYNELPKEYRDIIFNNLIAKSISNNTFADELSLYLNKDEAEEILNKLKISFKTSTPRKRKISNKTYIKEENKAEKEISENEDVFSF